MLSHSHKPRSSSTSSRKASITGVAIRHGHLHISEPLPYHSHFEIETSPQNYQVSVEASRYVDLGTPRPAPQTEYHPIASTQPSRVFPNMAPTPTTYHDSGRTSVGPSIVHSTMSTGPSRTSLHQGSQPGFRGTIRRIFGGKRSRSSIGDSQKEYFLSDPGNLAYNLEKQQQIDHKPPRTPSKPINDVTQSGPLDSHSPFQLPVNSKDDRSHPEQTDPSRKRRNTLPSVAFTEQDPHAPTESFHSVDMQPRSNIPTHPMASPELSTSLKRRSRSADALNELAAMPQDFQSISRRRSDEIASWRNNVTDHPKTSHGLGYRTEQSSQDPGGPATKVTSRHTSNHSQTSLVPPQTFDFGLPGGPNESVSLEERISTLEVKVADFEYAIAKLQGHNIPRPSISSRPPKRSTHELFANNLQAQPMSSNLHHERSFLSLSKTSQAEDEGSHTRGSSKSNTIRPSTAIPRSPKRSPTHTPPTDTPATSHSLGPPQSRIPPMFPQRPTLGDDHFETILAMVKEEQAARQRLETQVVELQKELDELRAPVYAYIRPLSYPTPSPESSHHIPVASKAKPLHRTPAFQLEDRVAAQEASRFSMTDADESDTEDGYQDVYETPRETRHTFEGAKSSPMISPLLGMG